MGIPRHKYEANQPDEPVDNIDRLLTAIHYKLTWTEARAELVAYIGDKPVTEVLAEVEDGITRLLQQNARMRLALGLIGSPECDTLELLKRAAVTALNDVVKLDPSPVEEIVA